MDQKTIPLPDPTVRGMISLETTLEKRRSVRHYRDRPLALREVSQLLWSAQGVTHPEGLRTAPSAGALNPLEIDLVAGRVDRLEPGIYRYRPPRHDLVTVVQEDRRTALWSAALRQDCVRDAPAVIVISAVYERTTWKYGTRGKRYVHMEVGHTAQNILLQAVALDLGAVVVGAFHDDRIRDIMNLRSDEYPLSLIPVGKRVRFSGA